MAKQKQQVIVYSTPTCPYCKMEAEYLQSKGINFEEIYVDKDPKAVQEMIAISGQMGVPFTVITKNDGSKVSILGFDKQKLDSALAESS